MHADTIGGAAYYLDSFVRELSAIAPERKDVAELLADYDQLTIEELRAFVLRYNELPERLDQRCAECVFYQHGKYRYGECRRSAPRAQGFPCVRPTQWCAKFARAEQPHPISIY